jgi:hypothetical protein
LCATTQGTGKITAVPDKVKSILRTQNDDPSSKGMHKVTFAKREDFSKKQHEANLEIMQRNDDLPTSKSYLRIFTRKSVVMLAYAGTLSVSVASMPQA